MKRPTLTFFFLLIMFVSSNRLEAQTYHQITSATDSQCIPFAKILYSSSTSSQATSSDVMGNFKLPLFTIDTAVIHIEISAVGYLTFHTFMSAKNVIATKIFSLTPSAECLEEMVVTAQYKPSTATESMHKITVIDQQKIEQMGAVNLREVLSNSLNIRLSQDNVLGSSMSMQGMSGENVKILLDGVPIIGRMNGNVDLSQINLQNIARIEIVEGPLSVQYGTNALAGTINLISKSNNSFLKNQVSTTLQYESIGNYNASIMGNYKLNKSSIQASFGRNYFDGWSSGDQQFRYIKFAPADISRYQTWKPKAQYMAHLTYGFQWRKWNTTFKSSLFNETILNRGRPLSPYLEKAFDDEYKTIRFDHAVNMQGKLSKRWNVNAVAAYNYYQRTKSTSFIDLTSLQKQILSDVSAQDTTVFDNKMSRASFVHSADSGRVNYEIGYDINVEQANGNRIENGQKSIGDYALFSTCEMGFSKLSIKPGVRYAYNSQYNAPVIPSINLKFSSNTKNTFRVSYARGFRAPTLKELYFNFVDINHNILGNTQLQAEQSHNFSGSWVKNCQLAKLSFQTTIAGFYNTIQNLITLALISGTQYSYINIGKYKTSGTNFNLNTQYKNWRGSAGVGVVGTYNALSDSINVPAFNYSKEINGALHYQFFRSGITVSLFYKYTGNQTYYMIDDEKVTQRFTSPYQMLDASMQKNLFHKKLQLTIGCKNIANITTILNSTASGAHSAGNNTMSIAAGRNYFIKATWNIF